MRIAAAYISLVLLWSTTPLAIKWSGEGPGFIFGATARMTIGTVCMLLMLLLMRQGIPMHRKALLNYSAVALQIYGAMMSVYWGAQFIPSGWISVLFGLTPFVTAILAAVWLGEQSLSIVKIMAYCLGVAGLALMFGSALELGHQAEQGLLGVLIAVFLQAFSAVWIKSINAHVPARAQVAGGLLLALPFYLLTWYIGDHGQWPETLTKINIASILYLGLIATTLGFGLYYYVLTHLPATHVALVTLISPVLALLIGNTLNQETLTPRVALGTILILSALAIHAFFDHRKPNKTTLKH